MRIYDSLVELATTQHPGRSVACLGAPNTLAADTTLDLEECSVQKREGTLRALLAAICFLVIAGARILWSKHLARATLSCASTPFVDPLWRSNVSRRIRFSLSGFTFNHKLNPILNQFSFSKKASFAIATGLVRFLLLGPVVLVLGALPVRPSVPVSIDPGSPF